MLPVKQKLGPLEAPLDWSEGEEHHLRVEVGTILPAFWYVNLCALWESDSHVVSAVVFSFLSVFLYSQPSEQLAHRLLQKQ